jgi:hypothetical protein
MLSLALQSVTYVRIVEGDLKGATRLLDESDAVATATGAGRIHYGRASLAGFRGIEAEALRLWDKTEADANARGEGVLLTLCEHARAVLYNGLGRYDTALGPARRAVAQDELWGSTWALPELVEAATGCGKADVANAALELLAERTRATGTSWALDLEARSRAAERRNGRGTAPPRGDRSPWTHARGVRAGPRPPGLRRVAMARRTTARRP